VKLRGAAFFSHPVFYHSVEFEALRTCLPFAPDRYILFGKLVEDIDARPSAS
jgi:hypothetical protein